MIFRQLFDARSSTYTYLLADEPQGEALIIDPVFEQHGRDLALIRELGLTLVAALETHVHADHVTGAWLLRERLGARIVVSRRAHVSGADVEVDEGSVVSFGHRSLGVRATPGHTNGCVSYVTDDEAAAFTGDALLIRGAGRTDFQEGSAPALFRSVRGRLFTLPDATLLYPAHDYQGRTVSTVAEERAHNPRLGDGKAEGDFVGFMENLGLPHPASMAVAVPANLVCGRPEPGVEVPGEVRWGPVVRTYAGVAEVDPCWVQARRAELTLIDVREPAELGGELGAIPGAVCVPLGQLRARLDEIPKDKAVITVCRSGARSAQASLILERAGVPMVANLPGGMLRWAALGLSDAGCA